MKVKGKIIREARIRKDYKQDDIAEILGISQSQYSKLEGGEVNFDIEKLGILMDELELNPLEVIEFSDRQQIFINSAMSGNNNNENSFNTNDIEVIRKIVQEELLKTNKKFL